MAESVRIQLTPGEARLADWATSPMEEFFEGLVAEGELDKMPELPRLAGVSLVVPLDKESASDLLYRLEKQAVAMIDAEPKATRGGLYRSQGNLVEKLKAAFASAGFEPEDA